MQTFQSHIKVTPQTSVTLIGVRCGLYLNGQKDLYENVHIKTKGKNIRNSMPNNLFWSGYSHIVFRVVLKNRFQ
jgi:hypothetical protein